MALLQRNTLNFLCTLIDENESFRKNYHIKLLLSKQLNSRKLLQLLVNQATLIGRIAIKFERTKIQASDVFAIVYVAVVATC